MIEKKEENCPVCNGTGEVQQTDIDFDTCRNCNGSGKIIVENKN